MIKLLTRTVNNTALKNHTNWVWKITMFAYITRKG